MNTSFGEIVFISVISAVIGFFLGGCAIRDVENQKWKNLMLKKGYAEMVPDAKNKVFQFKNETPSP